MYAVIPAWNEAARIDRAIATVKRAGCKHILVVANGCTDDTETIVSELQQKDATIDLLSFPFRLGVDVPRAIGSQYALRKGANYILFYDGDLVGHMDDTLATLLHTAVAFHLDLALCDCYGVHFQNTENDLLLKKRREIAEELHMFRQIGYANPAHGPSVVSARLIRRIPLCDLAQPPIVLAKAGLLRMHIDAPVHVPHIRLGSAFKDPEHTKKIRDTIIGDCLEALHILRGKPRSRVFGDHAFDGYHQERRFDIIKQIQIQHDS
ncbi:glycosyltransferase [Fodinisporobacter ferrooxydans]|uniref:Glycosyltransferase n=1 Tax=Fodinisporobacter ferrooxydans TaxID=2901836 RepID=A0ABY4CQG4_9BACL|nr:glycosyltransferase [Alicyclobacillaceae bacterium MYW30-H2]